MAGKDNMKGPETNPDQVFFEFAPRPRVPVAASVDPAPAAQPELPGQTTMPWNQSPSRTPGMAPVRSFEVPKPPAATVPVPSAALPPSPHDSVTSLEELARLAVDCRACGLRAGCHSVVFGEGNPKASAMFIGEGPGSVEDELGRPFVGPAGKLLDRILSSVGFTREEVYIANVVKCRPPGNRVPQPEEREACQPWLEAQIRLIDPLFLVLLGASAAQALLDPKARITQIRGHWLERYGRRVLPTYHPAALLRDETKKRPVWEDFKLLRAEHEKALAGPGR
ncbi:MAG: uracil-DNA glycosylase [Bacillota bacterium]